LAGSEPPVQARASMVGTSEVYHRYQVKWLSDSEILPFYNVFRKYRPSRGGGALIAVDKNIPCQIIDSLEGLETICIKITLSSPIS